MLAYEQAAMQTECTMAFTQCIFPGVYVGIILV